jgi:hypothetical protein
MFEKIPTADQIRELTDKVRCFNNKKVFDDYSKSSLKELQESVINGRYTANLSLPPQEYDKYITSKLKSLGYVLSHTRYGLFVSWYKKK